MTTTDEATPAEGLRDWARGLYPLEAATELLIRGGYAQSWRPWVHRTEQQNGRWWIDFEHLPDQIGGASGGERRFLLLAASISDVVDLPGDTIGDLVSGLDRDKVELVLAAIAHAAGTHEGSRIVYGEDGRATGFQRITESLHPWPAP